MSQFPLIEAMGLLLVQTISLSFFMGAISETRYGKSIWIFAALHAVENVVLLTVHDYLSVEQLKLFDNGYVLVLVFIVVAILSNYLIIKRPKIIDKSN